MMTIITMMMVIMINGNTNMMTITIIMMMMMIIMMMMMMIIIFKVLPEPQQLYALSLQALKVVLEQTAALFESPKSCNHK
jgi:archaellum biogenesis protein FlaJ (TadC family)